MGAGPELVSFGTGAGEVDAHCRAADLHQQPPVLAAWQAGQLGLNHPQPPRLQQEKVQTSVSEETMAFHFLLFPRGDSSLTEQKRPCHSAVQPPAQDRPPRVPKRATGQAAAHLQPQQQNQKKLSVYFTQGAPPLPVQHLLQPSSLSRSSLPTYQQHSCAALPH